MYIYDNFYGVVYFLYDLVIVSVHLFHFLKSSRCIKFLATTEVFACC